MQRWFEPMLRNGSRFCADNVQTDFAFLKSGEIELPLTINDAERDNSWICSPWTHYVSYAREEMVRNSRGLAGWAGKAVLTPLGAWLRRTEINRAVMINNWLLSTSPWPRWNAQRLPKLLETLIRQWPSHALIFRSLNGKESGPLLAALRRAGALLIPSRQVWWFDCDSPKVRRSRDVRKDVGLLRDDRFQLVPPEDLQPPDFTRLRELYAQLYLDKYSRHNPQLTTEWMAQAHAAKLLRFTALRGTDGRLTGVEGCGVINGILTSPIIGYDRSLPADAGLYRRLAVIPILESQRLGVPLNLSSGVGPFKANRGGIPVMEYLGVFVRHLPAWRRRPWQVIHWFSENVLAPYVRKRNL